MLSAEMLRREQLRVPRAQLCYENGARRGGEAGPLRGLRAELLPRLVRGLSPTSVCTATAPQFWEQQALRDGKRRSWENCSAARSEAGAAPCCPALRLGAARQRAAPDAIQGWRVVSARSKRQLGELSQPLAGVIGNALLRYCR